jgi:filamentous hemagglutinin family protein
MKLTKYILITMLLVLANCTGPVTAWSLPEVDSIESGDVTFNLSTPGFLEIFASDNSIIRFSSFNIGLSETVQFSQTSSDSWTTIKVLGNDPIEIYGTLIANGGISFYNDGGYDIGSGASISIYGSPLSSSDVEGYQSLFITSGGTIDLTGGGQLNPAPEPASLILFGIGGASAALLRRKKKNRSQ